MTKVLIIDDAPADRRLLRDALEADGFEVEEAEDGQGGLRKLFTSRPDVIVLDVLMPNMDGWEVCKRVREITETPIVMLTSLDREEEIVRGLDLGADDFVSKPVSPRHLIARVKAVARRAHSHAEETTGFRYDDGALLVDTEQHEVLLNGKTVTLSPIESWIAGQACIRRLLPGSRARRGSVSLVTAQCLAHSSRVRTSRSPRHQRTPRGVTAPAAHLRLSSG